MNISRILKNNYIKYVLLRRLQSQVLTVADTIISNKPKNSNERPRKLLDGPNLRDFFKNENLKDQENIPEPEVIPYLQTTHKYGEGRKVYFDIYGCQMNVNDTEIIWSILKSNNFLQTESVQDADVILIITCAIREGAENKIWNRLEYLRGVKKKHTKVGILGCMAERLKHKILEKSAYVDLIAGPDSYKDLPRLLTLTDNNQTAVNVLLSLDETYADVMPVRLDENSVTAYVSIMRGCDNMCTYCIVPFTRGRERSRPLKSILNEVKHLSQRGVKQITLLGQNVNSYCDLSEGTNFYTTNLAKGFKTVYKSKIGGKRFVDLLHQVSEIDSEMRVRFTSPHPKDFPNEVLELIKHKPNLCKHLHLPAQSGNSAVLERMRRGYTREAYLELVANVKQTIPDVALSSDFICGFCGETEEEFLDTITLIETVRYNSAYIFQYSMREKTTAHRRFQDDVPKDIKQKRLEEMNKTYRPIVDSLNCNQIGRLQLVLVEGKSKRSDLYLQGRNDSNIKVILPAGEVPTTNNRLLEIKPGDYVVVQINTANSQVLKGIPLYHTTLNDFHYKNVDYFNMDNELKYKSLM